ncbi:MAG: hypothetical protein C4527_04020 [Candidatus Omnitrophota bacterium]|jgi:hypothetical protein|nr:MAG: hypothetical protein C4527_04020 [Candidatus Omnitrophota bacterium]
MPKEERWQLIDEEVTLYAPEISRNPTPDEFLETESMQHTIISFNKVLVGCKEFSDHTTRDEWIRRHPLGKRIELVNPQTGERKAGNIIEVRMGDEPDEHLAAIMIYIERLLPPEHVQDWVI